MQFRAASAPMQRHIHSSATAAQQSDIPVQQPASRKDVSHSHSAPSSSSSSTSASDYGQRLWHSSPSSAPASHDQQCSEDSSSSVRREGEQPGSSMAPCLFAFPAESNFSGARYEPAVINQIQTHGLSVSSSESHLTVSQLAVLHHLQDQSAKQCEETQRDQSGRPAVQGNEQEEQGRASSRSGVTGIEEEERQSSLPGSRGEEGQGSRWHVLIDAAKACASSPPDLTQHPADFVVRAALQNKS